MSDYVKQRLAEIGASEPEKPEPMKKTRVYKPHSLPADQPRQLSGARYAHLYVQSLRRSTKTPEQACWFDVRDAYIAGFEAAIKLYEVKP